MISSDGPFQRSLFSELVQKELASSMKLTVVVCLLNGDLGYNGLNVEIKSIWKPDGKFRIVDLENSYYLVMFEKENDFIHALLDGLWLMRNTYLIVQLGTPHFVHQIPPFPPLLLRSDSLACLFIFTKKK